MDIERLTARNKNGLAYLVKVKPNEQEVDSPYKNTLKCILDCFERLAQYEEAEIANQSVIAKSATSEEVQEAIEQMEDALSPQYLESDGEWTGYNEFSTSAIRTAIAALQAYQPWIPVSERLPEGDMASVLIYTKEGGVAEGQYYPSIDSWKQFRWSVENSKVTHWKPLPEPPKGE